MTHRQRRSGGCQGAWFHEREPRERLLASVLQHDRPLLKTPVWHLDNDREEPQRDYSERKRNEAEVRSASHVAEHSLLACKPQLESNLNEKRQ